MGRLAGFLPFKFDIGACACCESWAALGSNVLYCIHMFDIQVIF